MIYDLVIIGMGPAGVSAAIYAKRANLNVLCIEKAMIGGYVNYIDRIDNYAGLYGISGPDLAMKFLDTIKEMNIKGENLEVVKVVKNGDIKEVVTNKGVFKAKNVIVATGRVPRRLGLAKEKELLGKGISNCALCDGAFFRNKVVAVVGGGVSALQESLYLSNICSKVYLIHRKDKFSIRGQIVDSVIKKNNIEFIMKANVIKINDNSKKLESIVLDNGMNIKIDGLFVYIGFEPNAFFVDSLNIVDDEGYISVDENYETKIEGIYAIGDIIKKDIYQISVAVGEGAIVANKVINSLLDT